MTDDADDDNLDLRWPKEGDRMFGEAGWSAYARVTVDPAERFYRMPKGYKRAGDILIDRAKGDLADRHNIIFPALFCYRQSIELFLKKIIDRFGRDDLRTQRKTHKLDVLWTQFMQVVDERGGAESVGLDAAAKLVHEMNNADKKSDAFRFATDMSGFPFHFGEEAVDLSALREAMQALANFFECCYMAYEHEYDLGHSQDRPMGTDTLPN
jgi:hypothetical protein